MSVVVERSPIPNWLTERISNRHLVAIGIGWVTLFFVFPILFLVVESLNFGDGSLFEAYHRATGGVYVSAFVRSFIYGFVTTVLTLVFAYVLAYYLAFASKRVRLLLTLVVVPLWIAYIIRYFGLMLFFSPTGPLAQVTGLEIDLLFTSTAVVLGLTNAYLPFAVLPIYNSLNAIHHETINASRVLGAGQFRTIREVVLPLSMPGIIAAGVIVFILATGSFLGPAVLGGPNQSMIANEIARTFLEAYNIQLASALAVIYTVLLVAFIAAFNAVFNLQEALGNL
ncbi:ABC transporter permease [Natronorubrum thiooxidans]|uniref:Spermidine/putrescine transport system permease protein n=1 Tax=Natronorubrum thiooxidans TaxID=308853 RepID=A0A1N7GRG3_9EURY|nr:ABC transporter permease [Natronorubrum thiooxidans]SIS15139.1 spermidine/putrescine transport system permease protein [Natronorubrum thiooxidans]